MKMMGLGRSVNHAWWHLSLNANGLIAKVIEMQEAITMLIFKLQTLPHVDMQQWTRHISFLPHDIFLFQTI